MFWALSALLATAQPPQDPDRERVLEEDIRAAVRDLSSDSYWDAAVAKHELLAIGRRAVPALIEAFRDNPPRIDEEEKSIRVRYFACEILGEIRADSDDALEILTKSLSDDGRFGVTTVGTAAAAGLGRLGSDRAIEPLREALGSALARRDRAFLGECIVALGNLRARAAADELVKLVTNDELTESAEPQAARARAIGCLAVDALGKIRASAAVPEMVRRIDAEVRDPLTDETIGDFVVRALRRIRPEDASKTDEQIREWARAEAARFRDEQRKKEAEGRAAVTRERMAALQAALAKHLEIKLGLPATLPELQPEFLNGSVAFVDGWEKPFAYQAPGTGGAQYDLASYGADGVEGGAGPDLDIWSHELWQPDRIEKTKALIRKVADAAAKYRKDQGRHPFAIQDLFVQGIAKTWPEKGYLPDLDPAFKDPFGAPLLYRILQAGDAKPFELKSLGRDRTEGGEGIDGDLSVWDLGWKAPE